MNLAVCFRHLIITMMATSQTSLLDKSSVSTDITFKIKDSGTEVTAHKNIIGMASPVFNRMFYGSLKESNDVVVVKETSADAFNAMIDFIYGNGIKWAVEDNIEELFAIGNMAERYQIKKLAVEVKKRFDLFKLTKENVVILAATALEFVQFEDLSSAMFLHYAKFFKEVQQ